MRAPKIPEGVSYFITLVFSEPEAASGALGLFLLEPSSSTGNDKSTGQQQQNGNKPQLLPLSQFPEGQKEFSSQLEVTTLRTKRAKLCETEWSTYTIQSTADY